jgi:hypothetical protein
MSVKPVQGGDPEARLRLCSAATRLFPGGRAECKSQSESVKKYMRGDSPRVRLTHDRIGVRKNVSSDRLCPLWSMP